MGVEIERKYLVKDESYKAMAAASVKIEQGYLSADPRATVRLRISAWSEGAEHAFITVKSKNVGAARGEWEYEIPVDDARQMMPLCCRKLEKTRYAVPFGGYTWEVDAFAGKLSGLVVAEVELPSVDVSPALPPFAGEEVTGDPAYYNSNLCSVG